MKIKILYKNLKINMKQKLNKNVTTLVALIYHLLVYIAHALFFF